MKFLPNEILDAVKAILIYDRSYNNLIHYLKGNVMTCLDGTLNSINFYFGNPKRGLEVKKDLESLLEETKDLVEGKIVSLNNITILIVEGKRVILFKSDEESVSLSLDVEDLEERYNVDYIRKGTYKELNYTITDLLSKEDEDIVEGWLITLSKEDEMLRKFILNNTGNKKSLQSIVDQIEDEENEILNGGRFFDEEFTRTNQ